MEMVGGVVTWGPIKAFWTRRGFLYQWWNHDCGSILDYGGGKVLREWWILDLLLDLVDGGFGGGGSGGEWLRWGSEAVVAYSGGAVAEVMEWSMLVAEAVLITMVKYQTVPKWANGQWICYH